MELDTQRIGGWIESLLRRSDEIADVFIEQKRSIEIDWIDGEIRAVRTREDQGLSARWSGQGRESLVFVSEANEAGAREAIRSLQQTLGRPPLPVKPSKAVDPEPAAALEAERWSKRLAALLSRVAPRHRLRWSLSETTRHVLGAPATAATSARRLLSLTGSLTAASKSGDEVRPFSFHAPDAQATADELRLALAQAAQPRGAAAPCGDGVTDVVLAGGCAAVFFHEILSHPLEAGQTSPLSNLELARVAVAELDVRDDATRLDLFGGYERDDEGVRPRAVKLLDAGRLASQLTDRAHAGRGGSNGHARRAGPEDSPLPRGANVVVSPGQATADEMARRLSSGLWIDDLERGSIELSSGRFRLRFPRARRVRRGRLADECGPGLLAGEILPALKGIDDAVGRETRPYRAFGFCARGGQVVPVQGAAPDLLVRGLDVRCLG